jgi:type IX secretion system substrate protein
MQPKFKNEPMKKYFLLYTLFLICLQNFAQVTITTGARWVNSGNINIVVQDLDLLNNGNFTAGNSLLKFTGGNDKTIGGSTATTFYDIEIAKTGNKKVALLTNASLNHQLNFNSGFFDLNQKNITLANNASLNNENENSRMIGPLGGEAIITLNMNNPNSSNPGNLGCMLTSSSNLGSVTIKRGHKTQTGTGLNSSINRYYNIQPTNNSNLNATFRFKYFNSELNLQNENTMVMFKSADGGVSWINQAVTSRDTVANYVEKTGIPGFSIWTLSSGTGSPLPVIGLEFFARRINSTQVKLNWRTLQEINNLGFYVERKKETDNDFHSTAFVNSKAWNGNSGMPLEYEKLDTNNFTGHTYYRLKQTDIDGKFIYSVIRMVGGETQKQIVLKAWPIPSAGDLNILVQGINKNETVELFDAGGKLIQRISVTDNNPEKINKLSAGVYILRLSTDTNISQRIIVQ